MHALERRLIKLEPRTGSRIFIGEAHDETDPAEVNRVFDAAGATGNDLQILICRFGEQAKAKMPAILYIQEKR